MVKYCEDCKIQWNDEDSTECPLCFESDYIRHLLDDNFALKEKNKMLDERYWTLVGIGKVTVTKNEVI